MNAHGTISLAGFSYRAGATHAGEPAEVVVAGGLAGVVHRGVVVATHAQQLRADQADRAPRAPVVRRARDGNVIRVHSIRHDRSREPGAFANPQGRPRRKNSAPGHVA